QALRGETYNSLTQMDYSDPHQRKAEEAIWDRVGGYGYDPSHLDELRQSGGKLMMWTGASDEAIPPAYSVNYSAGVRARYGEGSRTFFSSYLIPGMFHCRGGENAPTDSQRVLLEAMQHWVETGTTPDELIMSNTEHKLELNSTSNTAQYVSGMSTEKAKESEATPALRTYRICPIPKVARFVGSVSTDINDALNWSCTGRLKP
ncbi:MAG: tannase/feruloyl esterase family alpha/beta hydrolase, partial [Sphingomonadaceae bacterium]